MFLTDANSCTSSTIVTHHEVVEIRHRQIVSKKIKYHVNNTPRRVRHKNKSRNLRLIDKC